MKRQNPELGKPKSYTLGPKSNEAFETFYKGIGIVPEDEWEIFLETMRHQLPTTFRITGSRDQAEELLKIIKGQYFSKFISRDDGTPKLEPKSLPWYPSELAWQLDFTKKQIKNDNTLKSLHGFLISETESGNISRQEAVSMLPPLLMDVQPHHKVLDMCAAPGSKTAQLIEMLHSDDNVPVPSGYVVANDMDNKRCYLMTHQVKRIQSPNCMIINHDARILPNMFTSNDEDAEVIKYDRILCDVPCSGDGTMRKNPDIWTKWHVNGGYNLHRIQKKVLQRGLELLAVGGRLVYSTCSLNPVEDEAVILALIKQCKGAIELVDVSDKLPGLNYSKGTYSWKVMTKKGEWYETEEQAPEHFKSLWDSTIYPPIITEAQDAKLERCIRVLPHQQNTGAFFIAVIHKTQELPWSSGRVNRRVDPIINPKVRLDEAEKKIKGSEHFTFGVRNHGGLYTYARCNLCNAKLQGRNDYNSHLAGRKHKKEVEDRKLLEEKESLTQKSDEVKTENSDTAPVAMETQNTDTIKTEDTVDKQNENDNSDRTENVDKVKDNSEKSDSNVNTDNKNEVLKSEDPQKSGDNETGAAGQTADDKPPPAKKMRMESKEEEIKVVMFGHKEDPFLFCSKNDPIWPSIQQFYEISEDLGIEQIMYRNMKRILYYVSKPIRNLVICNSERVKFINLGVKCFSNAPSPLVPDCDFRLSQDGLLAIHQHIRGRRVSLTKQDIITILSQENPFICKLSPSAQESVYAMDPGSTLFHFKPSESDPEPNVEIIFCGWRGKTSVRSFVGKDERSHYLRLCGVELTDIQAQVQEMKLSRDSNTSSVAGTETPVGVPSGDEAEVEQWNKETEESRGAEADEIEEGNGSESLNGESNDAGNEGKLESEGQANVDETK
ncbi:RNA cytosine-C(5)-methyltransferase NSUN2-like [Ruditapes philippinarum]|uniref:RNA cytosine-C(5)-methyltransferase NSUN2-like n=1 Tax=Ruditapes philippinarum TaxID=129788 RepID=UPI00295B42A2|nr:RNA cytosine-C(5)-methyltransferase NSUN2-like [Ruditapes philippinarum]